MPALKDDEDIDRSRIDPLKRKPKGASSENGNDPYIPDEKDNLGTSSGRFRIPLDASGIYSDDNSQDARIPDAEESLSDEAVPFGVDLSNKNEPQSQTRSSHDPIPHKEDFFPSFKNKSEADRVAAEQGGSYQDDSHLQEESTPLSSTDLIANQNQEQADEDNGPSLRDEITSRAKEKIKDAAEQRFKGAGKKAAQTGIKEGAEAAETAAKIGAQTAVKTVATEAAADTALAATGVVTGGVTTVIAVGLAAVQIVKELWAQKLVRNIIVTILVTALALASLGILIALSVISGGKHFGPDFSGGTFPQKVEGPFVPGVSSGDKGVTTGAIFDELKANRVALEAVLNRNKLKLSASQISQAKNILAQMKALEPQIITLLNVSPQDSNKEKGVAMIEQYRQLNNQLVDTMYPGAGAARAAVLAQVDSGKIRLHDGTCRPNHDIRDASAGTHPNLLNALADLAKQLPPKVSMDITCIKTGHEVAQRRYMQRYHVRPYKSDHDYGRAVDITATRNSEVANALLPYIVENRERLHIEAVIFNNVAKNSPSSYYNISRGQWVKKFLSADHTGHIHLAVFP